MRPLILMSSLTIFAACGGGGLEGTYLGEDAASGERTGFLDSITFKSGNQLEATFLGQTKQGTYTVEGKRVTVKVADDDSPEVLTILDDGCLEAVLPAIGVDRRAVTGPATSEAKARADEDSDWPNRFGQHREKLVRFERGELAVKWNDGDIVDS